MGFCTRLLSQNTVALLCLCFLVLHIDFALNSVLFLSHNFMRPPPHFVSITADSISHQVRLAALSALSICARFYDARQFDFDFLNMVYVTEMLRIIDLTVTRWKVICLKCHHAESDYSCGGEGLEVCVISVFQRKLFHSSDNQYSLTLFLWPSLVSVLGSS